MLSMYFPPNYPSVAPDIRFITPIQHCNINAHGRVRGAGKERDVSCPQFALLVKILKGFGVI